MAVDVGAEVVDVEVETVETMVAATDVELAVEVPGCVSCMISMYQ